MLTGKFQSLVEIIILSALIRKGLCFTTLEARN